MASAKIDIKTSYAELMSGVEKNIIEAARRFMATAAQLTEEHEQREGSLLSNLEDPQESNGRSAVIAERAVYLKNKLLAMKEKNKNPMMKSRTRKMEAAASQAVQAGNNLEARVAARYFKADQQSPIEKESKAADEDWVLVDGMEDWEILRGT